MDKHTVSFYPTSLKALQERPCFISVSCWGSDKLTKAWDLLSPGPGNTIVPNLGTPQHIQRDGIHLFKMLHIQISLGKTASDSKLQQQGDQALVCCITMPVQSSSPLTSPPPQSAHSSQASPSPCLFLLLAKTTSLIARPVPPHSTCLIFPPDEPGTARENCPHYQPGSRSAPSLFFLKLFFHMQSQIWEDCIV